MVRFGQRALLGLALSISVLAGACSPQGPSGGPTSASVSPSPQVLPTATGTATPADIQATLTRITQYDQQLKQTAADSPSGDDVVNTLQEILTLADYATTYYPQMTAQQRTQALSSLAGILGDEIPVVNAHARVFQPTATAYAIAHPSPTPGPGTQTPATAVPQATPIPSASPTPPVAGTGTPTVSPAAQQLISDLTSIRSETVNLANDQPTDQDIVNILNRLQSDLNKLSQQTSGMSESDVVSVLSNLDRAVAYLVPVVQTRVSQENASVATPTPPATATPQTTPTPQKTGTPAATSAPAAVPSPTP